MNNPNDLPKMEAFVVGESKVDLPNKWKPVYEELVRLAELDPPHGLRIQFGTNSGGINSINRIAALAGVDGWQVMYSKPVKFAREIHLVRMEDEA